MMPIEHIVHDLTFHVIVTYKANSMTMTGCMLDGQAIVIIENLII